MAGKKKSEKESSWIGEIEKYSRQIWLAGLGAYSKVSKDGSKLFETLVKDGEKAEKEAKSDVDAQVGAAKASARSAKSKVDEVRDRALGKWSELEEAFDKRLNRTCRQAGCEKACGEEAGRQARRGETGRSRRVFERARCPRRHTGCQRSGSERSGDAEQPGLSPGGNAHARHSPGVFHSGPR